MGGLIGIVARPRVALRRLGAVALAAAAFSGCAGKMPRPAPTAERGLLQGGGASYGSLSAPGSTGVRAVSIPPYSKGRDSDDGFIWPVSTGTVSSHFGKRRRDYHDGIDIKANRGTPVLASKAGDVIYSSRRIGGYGNMIVIRHPDGTATVYAHNRRNLVKRGDLVKQGEKIALVGSTGKSTGPHLHFEIRKGELPRDPLLYLPQGHSALARE